MCGDIHGSVVAAAFGVRVSHNDTNGNGSPGGDDAVVAIVVA